MVAICDIDEKNQNFAAARWPEAKKYHDFRKMFDEMGKSIDAFTVSTPDHCHAVVAAMGMRMGKHAFVQKPMTKSLYEARVLGQIAAEKQLATQMGNQGTASSDLRQAAAIIKSGVMAGMEGSGQGLFLRSYAGLVRPVAGRVEVEGKDLTGKSYHVYKNNGVEFLPAARLEEGLVPGLTLSDHFVLAEEPQGVFIDRETGLKLAQERIVSFNIKGRPESTVESLSGGNQQRALLSLLRSPLWLVLIEHPTRGLDIESVIYMWGKLKERCRQGAAIIFISSDLEEILQYSDRVLVFFTGKVSQPLDASGSSVEQLGQLIGGKGFDEISGQGGSHAKE